MLSINERGVIDGEIPSIKTHPNFRWVDYEMVTLIFMIRKYINSASDLVSNSSLFLDSFAKHIKSEADRLDMTP